MPIKIIDNKKVDISEEEHTLYHEICRSYDRSNFKGEELFKDLFESDNNGIILSVRPPSNRHTSLEVIIFVFTLMNQQQIRIMNNAFNKKMVAFENIFNEKLKEFQKK